MELSLFLAQLFGLTMIIFAIVAFFRPVIISSAMRDLKNSSLTVLMASLVTMMGGLAVVLSHNIWEFSWVGLVTFFGWAALIKGVSFIAFPNILIKVSNQVMDGGKRKVWLMVALVGGCYLAFKGFGY